MTSLKALSLFSGAGGMDIGVRKAGFNVLASIEKDPYCCQTLNGAVQREQLDTKIIQADITTIDPLCLGIPPHTLDLLFGGPPCQSFSQIGKQLSLDDERGELLFEMVRFAAVLRPKAVLIEQVKGLLSAKDQTGKKGAVFIELINQLKMLGYNVQWKLINTADYGIPQLRNRLFIVALEDATVFSFPQATHSPMGEVTLFDQKLPYVTVGQVIGGLFSPLPKGSPTLDSHVDVTPDGDRQRIHGVPEGSHLAAQAHLPDSQRKNLTPKDTTKFLRTSFSAPSKTLRCGEIFFHPTEDRYLTPREYMRIHGYPDNYYLQGPIRGRSGRVRNLDQYRQIANSVPPLIAFLLAQSTKDALLCQNSLKYSDTL
jgi:DNA (cytosine-5)-methyltransferase 1